MAILVNLLEESDARRLFIGVVEYLLYAVAVLIPFRFPKKGAIDHS